LHEVIFKGVVPISERLLKVIVPLLAIFAHLGALVQFGLQRTSLLPLHWRLQFESLLAFSLILSVLPFFYRRPVLIWTVLCLKGVIFLVVGLPMGGYLGIEMTLLTALLIEAIVYTEFVEGLVYSGFVIFLTIIFQHRVRAWGVMLPAASIHDIVSLLLYSTFIVTLTELLRLQNNVPMKEVNRRFHEATFRLAEINIQLQEYAALAEQQSAADERKSLSREIHDSLGYTLTNLLMMLEAALDLSQESPEELPEHLERTRDQAKEGLAEIRHTLNLLRKEQQSTKGLSAIHKLVDSFTRATHLEVELNLGDAPLHFGEEADWVAYRLVQEGITNAIRHGKATQIFISFFRKGDGIGIQIRDNGNGTPLIEEGYGLIGMRERIERLGGNLTVSSKPGDGFLLSAWIPCDLEKENHG
jgi:signal transduction histidine kinase